MGTFLATALLHCPAHRLAERNSSHGSRKHFATHGGPDHLACHPGYSSIPANLILLRPQPNWGHEVSQ